VTRSAAGLLPLSHAQQALWMLHQVDPGRAAAYHTGAALLVHAPLDPAALHRAVDALAARHDALRSTFHADGATLGRAVHPRSVAANEVRRAADRPGERLREAARRALDRPFALDAGSFRFVAFDGGEPRFLLLMAAHHIATDALSNWVLLRDLLDLYAAAARGESLPDPAPGGPSYQDFVAAEAALLASPRRAALEEHWLAVCRGARPAELPADRPRSGGPGGPGTEAEVTGATHRIRLDAGEVAAVRAAAAGCEVTPFAWLLGGFQALVGRSGQPGPFLLGCPSSARTGRAQREVVGNFVNTLLFRADLDADPVTGTTARALAHAAQHQVGEGMRAVGYPFSLLARLVNPPRRGAAVPLCRITFNLIGAALPDPLLRALLDPADVDPEDVEDGADLENLEDSAGGAAAGSVERSGVRVTPVALAQSEGQLDLAVHLQVTREAITVEFRYDTALFTAAAVGRLADRYRHLLAAVAADPDRPVVALPLPDEPPAEPPDESPAEPVPVAAGSGISGISGIALARHLSARHPSTGEMP